MTKSHDQLLELCTSYALSALDGEELREFEAHLKSGCPSCKQQVREFAELTARIPEALPDIAASNDLKDRLMAEINREPSRREVTVFKPRVALPPDQKSVRRIAWLAWACAAAAGIALVISFFNISRLNDEISGKQSKLEQQQEKLEQQQEKLDQLQNQLRSESAFLNTPELRVTMLAGTEKSPRSTGKILWNARERKALFYAANLPTIPPGKTYQLWIIAANKPFDAGIFSVDKNGNGFLRVDFLSEADKAQKFAVTLEPAGGVPQPTGEMHLLGSL
jgi:anti-sigma-K factor RskA